MKSIYALLVTMLLLSCSTDDSALTNEQDILIANGAEMRYQEKAKDSGGCFSWVTGSVSLTGGIVNPVMHFRTQVNTGFINPDKAYTVALHIQPIEDCEDLNSDIGNPTVITLPYSIIDTSNIPDILVYQSQLPSVCFKWRVVISTVRGYSPACSSSSQWYDAPLL